MDIQCVEMGGALHTAHDSSRPHHSMKIQSCVHVCLCKDWRYEHTRNTTCTTHTTNNTTTHQCGKPHSNATSEQVQVHPSTTHQCGKPHNNATSEQVQVHPSTTHQCGKPHSNATSEQVQVHPSTTHQCAKITNGHDHFHNYGSWISSDSSNAFHNSE